MSDFPVEPKRIDVVVGSDEFGLAYKEALKQDLEHNPLVASVTDVGISARTNTGDAKYPGHAEYADFAFAAAEKVAAGTAHRALLVCGTGLGMAIAANKVKGVRAVTAHDSYSVERSVLANNAQVLTLGQRVIGLELARRLVREWLTYRFDHDSHRAVSRARLVCDYEQQHPRGGA